MRHLYCETNALYCKVPSCSVTLVHRQFRGLQFPSGDKLLLGDQRRLGSSLPKMARLEGSPSF